MRLRISSPGSGSFIAILIALSEKLPASAPRASRRVKMSRLPLMAATCRAVHPRSFFALMSAPRLIYVRPVREEQERDVPVPENHGDDQGGVAATDPLV